MAEFHKMAGVINGVAQCFAMEDQECELCSSLVPRPSFTANLVEGLLKLLRRVMSGGRLEWLIAPCIH